MMDSDKEKSFNALIDELQSFEDMWKKEDGGKWQIAAAYRHAKFLAKLYKTPIKNPHQNDEG